MEAPPRVRARPPETTAGSGAWNSLFVGLGYALGSQWQDLERYSMWFDLGILVIFAIMIGAWVTKRARRRSRARALSR